MLSHGIMRAPAVQPASCKNCGIWVVLPLPVSPTITVVACCSTKYNMFFLEARISLSLFKFGRTLRSTGTEAFICYLCLAMGRRLRWSFSAKWLLLLLVGTACAAGSESLSVSKDMPKAELLEAPGLRNAAMTCFA